MNIDEIMENARMKGRIIALEAEVSSLNAAIRAHERVDCLLVSSLKSEVERLTKAGDLLAFHYTSLGRKVFQDDPLPPSINNWTAAKKGGQP